MLQKIVEALKTNERDVPMALLYSADETTNPGRCLLQFHDSIGVPPDHHCKPALAELDSSNHGFIPYFRKAKAASAPIILDLSDAATRQEASALLEGIEWRGFGEPSKDVVVIPLSNNGRLLGFLVLGTNPRRAYDDSSRQFTGDCVQQISAKWASALGTDGARKREEQLLRDLAESEKRIRYMAHYAPVGMIQIARDGTIAWANDQYYDITGQSRTNPHPYSFMDVYVQEDLPMVTEIWDKLLEGTAQTSCELRLLRKFCLPHEEADKTEHNAWVLALGFPLIENGQVGFVMACLTDISHLKWAESVSSRNAAAATLAKKRQEEFIDITSHEMRNPLTAMCMLADGIAASLEDVGDDRRTSDGYLHALQHNVEAANIILSCAAHQKRIIDDVLMLSRLDSKMLSITPVIVQPADIVHKAVRMFNGELDTNQMQMQVVCDDSYRTHNVDHVYCDPSRLTQIFINLISNAIKFTRTESRREINVNYGAALQQSYVHEKFKHMKWLDPLKKWHDLTLAAEWGQGQHVYLYFSIQDTGPGLEVHEIDRLFHRFSQATSKTHITYGGSGLGLYICRELTEKQGGEIGVSSKPKEGTEFAFYIKARRAEPPTEERQSIDPTAQSTTTIRVSPILRSQSASVAVVEETTHKLNVLLVEDNLVNQKVLQKQLMRAHCNVHVANHGLEALEFLEKSNCWVNNEDGTKVDCILLDWEMPIMDGLTCSKRIRALEKEGKITKHLVVIAITANVRSEQIQTALDAGMDDVMPKPFLVADLMVKILERTKGG